MLFLLYWFIDYMASVFIYLIMFSCIGSTAVLVEDLTLQVTKGHLFSSLKYEYKIPYLGGMTLAYVIGLIFGISLTFAWYFTLNWMINNILGIILCITFLKIIRLSSLIPGIVLLILLFGYDIFAVFLTPLFTKNGESVMIAVATRLEAPIKLYLPHLTDGYSNSSCSLLGLGDILIPGIFICFLAKFGTLVSHSSIYFRCSLISYFLALVLCGSMVWIFHQG